MGLGKVCPGSKSLREPIPDDYVCPRCGALVEIWSDETKRTCSHCGSLVVKPTEVPLPECADWCPAAAKCLGEEVLKRRRERFS
jgi:DNA-directed RNA polymerase subunit RPC12/RpoP